MSGQGFVYEKIIDTLKADGTVPTREVVSALIDLEVKLKVQQMYVKQLRDGLRFYLPGTFWTEVVKETKAAEDQGKHADWILRLTDPDADVNA